MTKKPTIRDVAKLSSVSIGTVSRVLNSKTSVNPEIKHRVIESVNRLGYQPNVIAQSMRLRETRVIGFMVADISNPIIATMVRSAEKALREAGYAMMIANTGYQATQELELFSLLKQRQVDGLITLTSREDDRALINALNEIGMPVVLIERQTPLQFDSVRTDHGSGCYQVIKYLAGLGHRRIALITGSENTWPGQERVKQYKKAFADLGLEQDLRLVRTLDNSIEFGFQESYTLLGSKLSPTAIIAGVNETAGVMRAVRVLQLRIPQDLSIVAFGDSDLTLLTSPAITVVRWDVDKVGRTAARLLLNRLKNGEDSAPRRIMIPTEMVLRQSCAKPKKKLLLEAVAM